MDSNLNEDDSILGPNNIGPDIEVIVVRESDCETSTTVRPASPETRKFAEAYFEKLKKWRPEEYEQIMKAREQREKEKGNPPPA